MAPTLPEVTLCDWQDTDLQGLTNLSCFIQTHLHAFPVHTMYCCKVTRLYNRYRPEVTTNIPLPSPALTLLPRPIWMRYQCVPHKLLKYLGSNGILLFCQLHWVSPQDKHIKSQSYSLLLGFLNHFSSFSLLLWVFMPVEVGLNSATVQSQAKRLRLWVWRPNVSH